MSDNPSNLSHSSSLKSEKSVDFPLAPGETNVYGDRFMASVLTPYMKAQLMCSSTRFVYKAPNTLLGFIPLGFDENTVPVRNIASVSTNSRFYFGRALWAVILLILGAVCINNGGGLIVLGLLLLAFGCAQLVTAFPIELTVNDPSGGRTSIIVSSIEKKKLNKFRQALQACVFADAESQRHDEAQQLRAQQVMLQQMHMQQSMLQQQALMQQQQQQPSIAAQQQPSAHVQPPAANPQLDASQDYHTQPPQQ